MSSTVPSIKEICLQTNTAEKFTYNTVSQLIDFAIFVRCETVSGGRVIWPSQQNHQKTKQLNAKHKSRQLSHIVIGLMARIVVSHLSTDITRPFVIKGEFDCICALPIKLEKGLNERVQGYMIVPTSSLLFVRRKGKEITNFLSRE